MGLIRKSVIQPVLPNCPIDDSIKNNGMPQKNSINKYGTRKAPEIERKIKNRKKKQLINVFNFLLKNNNRIKKYSPNKIMFYLFFSKINK